MVLSNIRSRNFLQRLIFGGLAAGGGFVLIFIFNGYSYLIGGLALLVAIEAGFLTSSTKKKKIIVALTTLTGGTLGLLFILLFELNISHSYYIVAIPAITLLALTLITIILGNNLAPVVYGLFVICALSTGIWLLNLENLINPLWLLGYIFVTIISFDVGSYLIGKIIGKHKLVPSISPKKTWEGLFGGVGFVVIVLLVSIFTFAVQLELSALNLVIISTVLAFSALLGDLLESKIKRIANVKDSGKILPGHGGAMDRLDSISMGLLFGTTFIQIII